jgi:hypothetical protein
MKKVNEKNDDFLMKICGFWIRLRRTRFTAASIPLSKRDGHLHFASAVQLRLDTIAVFDHARLVESGTHTALLAADGQYAALWNAQAKYYV